MENDNNVRTASIPKNIAPTPRPSREEVISAHRTQISKKQ